MAKPHLIKTLALVAATTFVGQAGAAVASTEIAFSIQGSDFSWFQVTDPSVQGTLTVTGLAGDFNGNGLAYDKDQNRLLFVNGGNTATSRPLWSVSLAGLTLQNGGNAGSVEASQVGNLTFANGTDWGLYGASYYDGSYYAVLNTTDTLRRVTFDGSGNIASQNNIETKNVAGTGQSGAQMYLGDLDFDIDGNLYVSGENGANQNSIWKYIPQRDGGGNVVDYWFDERITGISFYNGILFNEAGDTLYGYSQPSAGHPYGEIDMETGALTTLYSGTPFDKGGDLSSGFTMNVETSPVLEPSSVMLATLLTTAVATTRRRRSKK